MTQPWYEPYLASVAQAVHPGVPDTGGGSGEPTEYTFSYPRDSLDPSENLHKGNVLFSTVHQTILSITGDFTSGQSGLLSIYLLDQKTLMVSTLATKAFSTTGGDQEIVLDTPLDVEPGNVIAIMVEDTASTGLELWQTNSPEDDLTNGFWRNFGREFNNEDPIAVGYDFVNSAIANFSLDVKSEVVTDSGTGDRTYWRMRFLECQSFAYGVVAEMEMRESIGGADTTNPLNYIEGDHHLTADGSQAFDSDPATWWRSAMGDDDDVTDTMWIGQDYGESPVEIKEITVQTRTSPNQNQGPRQGVVEYSDDNVTWHKAWAFATSNWGGSSEIKTLPDPNPGTGAPGASADEFRYWRLLCTGGGTATEFGISTLEFRESIGGSNTALADNAIASGPGTGVVGDPVSAFNNSGGFVYWRDEKDGSGEAWIGQDYGVDGEVGITEVLIAPPPGTSNELAPLAFDMQASSDGVTWVTQWSGVCEEWTQDAQIISREGFTSNAPAANGWRILVTETGIEDQVGIKSMVLRTSPGGPDAVVENNVEPNGESDARNLESGSYPATAAFGGQFSENGWRSSVLNPGANTWLAWVFYQPRAVVEVEIETDTVADYAPLEFRIQYYTETFDGIDGQTGGAQGTYRLNGGTWADAGVFSVTVGDYDVDNKLVLTLFE